MKESQKINLFLLSSLQEGEEAVEGSSIDPLTCNRPRGDMRENAQVIFPTFPKILSLPIK